MEFDQDFGDLFFELNAGRVEYLIVGGYAVIFHTEPRDPKDIDILLSPSPENARRALDALKRFGAPTDNLSARDLADPDLVIQLGVAPNRVDIVTKIKGVSFETAGKRRVTIRYADQRVWMLDLQSSAAPSALRVVLRISSTWSRCGA